MVVCVIFILFSFMFFLARPNSGGSHLYILKKKEFRAGSLRLVEFFFVKQKWSRRKYLLFFLSFFLELQSCAKYIYIYPVENGGKKNMRVCWWINPSKKGGNTDSIRVDAVFSYPKCLAVPASPACRWTMNGNLLNL